MKVKPHQGLQNRLIDAREQLTADVWGETPALAFAPSLMCSISLPYRTPASRSWERSYAGGRVRLRMDGGVLGNDDGWIEQPVPSGPRARCVLLALCSTALVEGPIITTDRSLSSFAKLLGFGTGGRDLHALRRQLNALSVVRLSFRRKLGHESYQLNGAIFRRLMLSHGSVEEGQVPLWPNQVEFEPEFYRSLVEHAVPIDARSIRALRNNSQALDLLLFLAFRLHYLDEPLFLTWGNLKGQFGTPGQDHKSWKRRFRTALQKALFVYPRAKAETVPGGVILYPSPPLVPARASVRGLLAV